ncbi:uncharacterized protein DUF4834 [Tenacibaculum adriaticum]|uniref:Uncharacterized protein DUF4834 n=1 Tax=Tenacibaculum adriaticum TaxID=413713 RepID=A0A5S5DNV1_9FLAO|nr:DUF4834 family protein [Tenacibaculum adriaticum]TYP96492.1 uncharacterized protein DUF4834 [Tenacibaculum adriaticum]
MTEIHQAGPMNFIKTILIILIIYYAFKFFAKLFAPYLMKKMADKMQQKAEQQFGKSKQESKVKEGETVIDKKPQNDKKSNDSVGEYVDFEEID